MKNNQDSFNWYLWHKARSKQILSVKRKTNLLKQKFFLLFFSGICWVAIILINILSLFIILGLDWTKFTR